MAIEIMAVGGYSEVGRNMTAIKVDDEVIICDMGVHLENYISLTEDEDLVNIHPDELIAHNACPNIELLGEWKEKVKAIIPTHAHLDHIGAIPFLARSFECPIICTPFTAALLNSLITDAKIPFKNKIKVLNVNSSIKISNSLTMEFVSITHSTPQTVVAVLHTPYGKIVYANDFKLDNYPVLGTKPNLARLEEIGNEGDVVCLVMDSLYAHEARKMPSESVARAMLKDVLLGTYCEGKAVICTTFSSHIARLKSMVDYGKRMGRKVIFLGRSLHKYIAAAESVGLVKFSEQAEIVKYSSKVKSRLNKMMREGIDKYLIICTGHQGEPQAGLYKMAHGMFDFKRGDHVVFSSSVIPSPTNQRNRHVIEEKLTSLGVRIFKDIHVSGHAAREDHRDMIEMLKPKHIVPSHSEPDRMAALADLAYDLGYHERFIHLLKNGSILKFNGA
ncbi:RNase J family beta-CASP ribonuclease [Candidatus Woesearchaeota archaeon]|nr:RNase J family beta-CASP ribonuclease [Candidatus Woesearchaeota archaeon]